MDKDQYIEAWDEDQEKKEVDPIVASVKAAKKADAEAYIDAFKNDNYGIDVEKVAEQESA